MGLIISEATGITQQGLGWPNAPGLWSREQPATRQLVPAIRRVFKGTLILNSDYSLDDASQALRLGEAEAIAFGRPFLANPDLPARLAKRAALNAPNAKTFYTPGPSGYTDYPALT
jgi:N-ethylmaleimide reductase